jgi:hypothetical protein
MTGDHPGISSDPRVKEARADTVEYLLGGPEALLEGASTNAQVEDLAMRKADALRDAAFAAGLRWAAAQARSRGLDRFSGQLADEAEEVIATAPRVTAVTGATAITGLPVTATAAHAPEMSG